MISVLLKIQYFDSKHQIVQKKYLLNVYFYVQ